MAAKRKSTRKRPVSKAAEEVRRARRQTAAVLLFAAAILVLCLAVIPGGSLWLTLHNGVLGLFGICAFLVPAAMIYMAVMASMETPKRSLTGKAWLISLTTLLLAGALQIFFEDVQGLSFWDAVAASYAEGELLRGGGVLGVLLGYPLEYALEDLGAKIVVLLAAFVFLMLVTRTTLIALVRKVGKPVKKTTETLQNAWQEHNERRQQKKKIDIEMGEGYPSPEDELENAHRAVDEELEELSGRRRASAEKPERTESLRALEQAAQELREEEQRPALRIEDIVGKAVKKDAPAVQPSAADKPQPEPAAEKPAGSYRYPPISLLDPPKPFDDSAASRELRQNADLLVKTLREFGVETRVVDIARGPAVTRYELEPSAGVKVNKITGLADDIALRLATSGVRIEAPIPNKAAVGIEVPNRVSATVCLRELIDSNEFATAKSKLTVALGRDISGNVVLADLAKMPHLLIAGTTGSGKSVCTNSMIQSILYRATPEEVKLLLIDPKKVEFSMYNGVPHLLVPVVTDPRKAAGALGWAVTEMLRRYQEFAANSVRDLSEYNEKARKDESMRPMPQILIVIDEMADLMMAASKEVEDSVVRLAQMARAAGMHMVIATQRPSTDVITGLIKANIPSRLALTVASVIDSRVILDATGAEKLLGRGDMLFMPIGVNKPIRVQGCFVSNREIEAVVQFLKAQEETGYDETVQAEIDRQANAAGGGKGGSPSGGDGGEEDGGTDDMLPQAIELVVEAGMASTSLLQRRLRLGYARAGRLIDEMEQRGIVGPHEGSKPRQVLITRQQWLEMNAMSDE